VTIYGKAANNRAHRVETPAELVEIIEEDFTEPGLKSDSESAIFENDNLNCECIYFETDRRVFTEELRPRIVEPKQLTVTSEFDVEPKELIKDVYTDDALNIGESSHSQLSRGRRES
jgi:hypothetical protein